MSQNLLLGPKGWAVTFNAGANPLTLNRFTDYFQDAIFMDDAEQLLHGLDGRLDDNVGIAANMVGGSVLLNDGDEVIAVNIRHHDVEKDDLRKELRHDLRTHLPV